MGLFGKTLCEARVSLYNLKRFDIASGDPVLAAVSPPPLDTQVGGRPAIAHLLPLTAVILLRNTARQGQVASPMMQLIGLAADDILAGPESARGLRLRDQVAMDPTQVLDDDAEHAAAGMIGVGLPELFDGGAGRPDKTFRAQVQIARGGIPVGAVRGVSNAFQAALGWFALLEWTAREMPYDEVAQPVARALQFLAHLYFNELDARPPSFAESNVLSEAVLARVRAE